MKVSMLMTALTELRKKYGDLDMYLYCGGKAYEGDELEVGCFSDQPKCIEALMTCRITGYRKEDAE